MLEWLWQRNVVQLHQLLGQCWFKIVALCAMREWEFSLWPPSVYLTKRFARNLNATWWVQMIPLQLGCVWRAQAHFVITYTRTHYNEARAKKWKTNNTVHKFHHIILEKTHNHEHTIKLEAVLSAVCKRKICNAMATSIHFHHNKITYLIVIMFQ